MSDYINIKYPGILKIVFLISLFSLLNITSTLAQDVKKSNSSNSIIEVINAQTKTLESLKSKITKLDVAVKSNENLVLKEEMKSMHAIDQFISLTTLINNVTNDVDAVLQQLSIMANTNELIENNDTNKNLELLIKNTGTIINGLNEMINNIEESQKILIKHNVK
jgi:hypothetical protein